MNEGNQYIKFAGSTSLMPQEEKLETAQKKNQLTIGIPLEQNPDESRIALIPEAVKLLTDHGHRILFQRGAGITSHFSDHEFAESGAELFDTAQEVFDADIVLKVAPLSSEEIAWLRKGQSLFSILQLGLHEKEWYQALMQKKVTAVAFEYIQDKTGALPLLRSMSEIIGNLSMMIAAEYLCHPKFGTGTMLGGFPGVAPTEVVIIGSGNVAEYATRAALGMGCLVKIFDNSMYKLRILQNNVGQRLFTSALQPHLIGDALKTADVVIAAKHAPTGTSPCVISEEMVKTMKAGAVIIDVSIDQGGCFETSKPMSHHDPVYQVHGVTHYAVPNMASRVPRTASVSFSNFFMPLLLEIGENGGLENLLRADRALAKGVYIYNGKLTNYDVSRLHSIPLSHLELLMAAFY
ncbi:MAG: alanine dehydrogenase [Bacteroidetes bacterium]|jgi:alanine dehydrogenase|nr:alanine dehydrogenase [Bacteroidota bacterium]